jgi:hypothetical protein
MSEDPTLNGISITPTSEVHTTAMLILLMPKKNKNYKGEVTSGGMMFIKRLMEI